MNDLDAFRILFCYGLAADGPEGPVSEISKSVDQQPGPANANIAATLDRVREAIRQREAIMARQGTVVASWRTRQGRKVGPYYRLAWREDGRQKSLYLGPSEELAQAVRQMLADLQRPLRVDRAFLAARKQGWAALRAHKIVLARELARYGLYLHGWEVRGWRNTTFYEKWPLPTEPEIPPLTLSNDSPDLVDAAEDTVSGPDQTCCGAAVPAALSAGETPAPQELSELPSSPGVLMENFAIAFSVSFASLWSLDRRPHGSATRRERHRGRAPHQDRPYRRNGPDVDQHPWPADPLQRANWRNRILLTNGPAARARAPPWVAELQGICQRQRWRPCFIGGIAAIAPGPAARHAGRGHDGPDALW
jgi:hypothetical protein